MPGGHAPAGPPATGAQQHYAQQHPQAQQQPAAAAQQQKPQEDEGMSKTAKWGLAGLAGGAAVGYAACKMSDSIGGPQPATGSKSCLGTAAKGAAIGGLGGAAAGHMASGGPLDEYTAGPVFH